MCLDKLFLLNLEDAQIIFFLFVIFQKKKKKIAIKTKHTHPPGHNRTLFIWEKLYTPKVAKNAAHGPE